MRPHQPAQFSNPAGSRAAKLITVWTPSISTTSIFTGLSVKRREATVNFDWGANPPASSLGSDTFSARSTGELIAPKSGTYRFYLTSDDGSRLSLANQVIMSDFSDHAPWTFKGSATLSEGQRIPLTLEYYDNTGAASLKLEWRGPGLPRAVIPAANLSAPDAAPVATGQTFYIAPDGNCIIIDDFRNTQHELGDPLKDKKYTASTLIENNVCAGNGGGGIRIYSSDNVVARHNTVYQNQITPTINAGEITAYDASNVLFVHNIVYALPGKRANGIGNATNIVYERNLYFGMTDILIQSSSDLIADPLFEAPSANLTSANFRLRPDSPAIDKAVGGQTPGTDIGGVPRPLGAAADLGAWESR